MLALGLGLGLCNRGGPSAASDAPTISYVRPAQGAVEGGSLVEVIGANLSGASVTVDGSALTGTTINSDGTRIEGRTPAKARGAKTLTVTTADGSAHATFTYLEPLSVANAWAIWDAEDAVDDGAGLATGIANTSGLGDSTRNLVALTTGGFAGDRPKIYTDTPVTGRQAVGGEAADVTGRAFWNDGGGEFSSVLSQPATWYIYAYVEVNTGDVAWFRLSRSGSLTNVHGLYGEADPNMAASAAAASGISFAITPGWHVICVVVDGANSYAYVDDMRAPVFGPASIGAEACRSLITGSFYNDPCGWKWATHFAYSAAHGGSANFDTRATIAHDYLADRYKVDRILLMTADADWHERDGAHLTYFNGKLRLYGGWFNTTVPAWDNTETTNEEWSSTDEGATWTQDYTHVTSPPGSGAGAHWGPRHTAAWTKATINGTEYLYVMGGDYLNRTADVWRTSDGTTWERMTNAAGWGADTRILHMGGALNGNLYVMGGQVDLDDPLTANSEVWRSTDGGATWTQLANAPWDARGMVYHLREFDGFLWLVGGGTYDNTIPNRTYFNDVWKFDGTTWTEVLADGHAQWAAREYHNVVVFDGKLWIGGGYNGSNLADLHYSEDGATWTQFTGATIPWVAEHAAGLAATPRGLVHASGNALDKYVYRLELHR